ncbi:MAG: GIY-YIG nuclease family protein [bacterium]|nr:GIY-YIG nuclease family protein [bacterium]
MEPYFLYILRSELYPRHYVGISDDPEKRLQRHNKGDVRSTKAYRPWKIICTEKFKNRSEATKRESFLKRTAKARVELFQSLK